MSKQTETWQFASVGKMTETMRKIAQAALKRAGYSGDQAECYRGATSDPRGPVHVWEFERPKNE